MNRLKKSGIGRAIKVLSRADQGKLIGTLILQILMAGLDLLGVLAIGLLGALSVNGMNSGSIGNRVSTALRILQIQSLTFQQQVLILGLSAVIFLTSRTLLSIFFTRKILFFLSRRGAKISAELISKLLSQSLLIVQSRTTQETVYAVTTGVDKLVIQVLANIIVWVADLALLVVIFIGLLVVDPVTSIATSLIFLLIGCLLFKFMHLRAENLGIENTKLTIKSNQKIIEVFASYRESVVRNRRDFYAKEIGYLRYSLANTAAELGFLPYVSKYVIETAVVVGAVLIGGAQFIFQDGSHAVATLAIFFAAGTRIAPAILRLQQGTISIKSGLGFSLVTLDLIDELGNAPRTENLNDKVDVIHEGFISKIEIKDVTLTYPNKIEPAISNISVNIPAGTSIAVVGPSGAGKTTLIDVLLGVLNPDSGSVLMSGLPPLFAVEKWPGAVSYMPQDVVIVEGTIRENIALGYPLKEATDDLVMQALRVAHLDEFVATLPDGIDTQVGEQGARISGGQRQRLGIARAMFTCPHLLVLDEATSSLDGETEASISDSIHALRGSTTVVIIAHRLSTVRNVDMVIYLSNGKVQATGTFKEVRKALPDFDYQAKIMGL